MLVFTPVNSIAIRWGFSFGIRSKHTTPINKHIKKYLILFYRGRVKKNSFFVANVCFVTWNCIYLSN